MISNMKKKNYYERVVKQKKAMKRNPVIQKFSRDKQLTDAELDRALDALLQGKTWFEMDNERKNRK